MNARAIFRARVGFTLLELMIVIGVLGALLGMLNQFFTSSTQMRTLMSAEDGLVADVADVWHVLSEDLTQSQWYFPTPPAAVVNLDQDREQLYLPFITQPTENGNCPAILDPSLNIFARSDAYGRAHRLDLRGWSLVDSPFLTMEDLDRVIPGHPGEAQKGPGDTFSESTTYRTNFFAASQELVFVRSLSAPWNYTAGAPAQVGNATPNQMPRPAETFPGSLADWKNPNLSARRREEVLQILYPSAYTPTVVGGAVTWTRRRDAQARLVPLPYGRVMESTYYDTTSDGDPIQPQLEQNRQPTYTNQPSDDVRRLGFQVVNSPLGFGRLVRTYLKTSATEILDGVEPGQAIARDGNTYVIVDKVISDNVVRVLFETARHVNDLGINGVRATVFFARRADKERNATVLCRAVTMVFTMRSRNTPYDQEAFRLQVKQASTVPGAGAIPFTY